MRARRTIGVWTVALALLGGAVARADFEILLRDGGTMVVDSYEIAGDKVIGYRGPGKLEVALSRVVNVRDRGIDQAAEAEAEKPQAPHEPPHWAPIAPRASVSIVTPADASAREAELSRAIALGYRDLQFAEYRQEPKEAIAKRKAAIAELEAERSSLKKISRGY